MNYLIQRTEQLGPKLKSFKHEGSEQSGVRRSSQQTHTVGLYWIGNGCRQLSHSPYIGIESIGVHAIYDQMC